MAKRFETSDGRYVQIAVGEWWDTTGTDLVPEGLVNKYLADHPDVGIVVLEVDDSLGELKDFGTDPHLH